MNINCEDILKECGIESLSAHEIISNIVNLEEFYDKSDLIEIYNYCLCNITNTDVVLEVIKLADAYKSSTTLKILIRILSNQNFHELSSDDDRAISIRALCAKAISNYKDYSTVTVLLKCLNNKNEHYRIRLACADALGRIGDKYAVQPLIDLVQDENEKSVYLKESAAFALGILGDSNAIDPLVSILEAKQGFWDKFSFLKEKIVEALGKLNFNNEKIFNALKKSLMDPSPMVRINAIEAIMNSNNSNSIELIQTCLNDEDDDVKKNALIALYNLCGRDILDKVIELPIYSDCLKQEATALIEEYEDTIDAEEK